MDDYKTRMNEEVALMHKEREEKYACLWSWRNVKSYDEIFKLEAMLKAEGIPFVYHRLSDMCGFQICYPEDGENRICSVILHSGSYGRSEGLLEIMGLLKPDEEECDDVVGYLTADDVFERIKAHHDGKWSEYYVWISSNNLLWSNNDYLDRVRDLTPPPVPYWMKQDEDSKIGFRQKDVDEVQKEIDEMTKRIYEKLEIKQVKDFDTDTAWHEYLTATETAQTYGNLVEPIVFINHKARTLTEFIKDSKATQEKEANNKEEKNMGPKDTTFAEFCRRIYWGTITPVKPERVLIQGTATIIWWSDGTKTVVKCQKGDKMDPEKGIAMCVMKKFMGTNETHSNYLDFAKPAIKDYEAKQKAMAAARKKAADKKRRAAKKEEKGNGEA